MLLVACRDAAWCRQASPCHLIEGHAPTARNESQPDEISTLDEDAIIQRIQRSFDDIESTRRGYFDRAEAA